jgi:phosphatidylglycerophosphatase A
MSSPTDSAPASPQEPPRLALLVATGFGLGYLPKAPGTWGSLAGVGMVCLLSLDAVRFVPHTSAWPLEPLPVTLALALIGAWASHRVAKGQGSADPQFVVIDEISGQQIGLLPLCFFHWHPGDMRKIDLWYPEWHYLLAGFILFRIFDIWKPWPVRAAEKLPGGWGIMADDWVAGIYAAMGLWGLHAAGM